MPRETKTTLALPLTEDEAKMLAYVLNEAAMGGMPGRWAGGARRLHTRLTSKDPDENVRRMLDVSTAHLTEQERDRLDAGEFANQTMTGEYGGMVYVSDFDTPGARPDGISDTFWVIYQHAKLRGCAYILFDRDAPFLPGFPVLEAE